ncbi:MAG: hypothetical protein DRP42_00640 [Tenericutes bacterium]|nr:MAG: hypothetical protein DRP42_00640 [Mycoplasmatota bacterium]
MGHSLEELLSTTGVGDMAGKQYEKTAADKSEPFDFRKLAEQCRAAADATEAHREARGRELVEKTAAVAVITKTIDEINEIIGDPAEKVASTTKLAEFVAAALDRGHSPDEVAKFLKTAGPKMDFLMRGGQRARAASRAASGKSLSAAGKSTTNLAKSEYQDLLRQVERTGSHGKMNRYLENLSRKFGDKEAGHILRKSGVTAHGDAAKRVMDASEAIAAKGSIGSKSLTITKAQVKKVGPYAIAGGAGMALGSRGD